jgi:phosphotransferase system, enzyme I, PtsP
MLETLRRIVEEVNAAPHRDEALAIIVRRVKEAMEADACSVYLIDAAGSHFVLMASDGVNPAQVGVFRVGRTEGIVGFVGERQEPVNLAIASEHPRYRFLPDLDQAPYCAFLGVPLIHLRRLLGVLVTQRSMPRMFSADEVAFLVTIAAQLAGAINDVTRGDAISRLLRDRTEASPFLQGIPGIPGVAIGTITLPDPLASLASVPDRPPEDVDAEVASFRAAVMTTQREIRERGEQLGAALSGEAKAILDAYVMLLDSKRLTVDAIDESAPASGLPARCAIRSPSIRGSSNRSRTPICAHAPRICAASAAASSSISNQALANPGHTRSDAYWWAKRLASHRWPMCRSRSSSASSVAMARCSPMPQSSLDHSGSLRSWALASCRSGA